MSLLAKFCKRLCNQAQGISPLYVFDSIRNNLHHQRQRPDEDLGLLHLRCFVHAAGDPNCRWDSHQSSDNTMYDQFFFLAGSIFFLTPSAQPKHGIGFCGSKSCFT